MSKRGWQIATLAAVGVIFLYASGRICGRKCRECVSSELKPYPYIPPEVFGM